MARGPDAFLDRSQWKRSLRDLSVIVAVLEANQQLRLAPVRAEDIEETMARGRGAAAAAAATGKRPARHLPLVLMAMVQPFPSHVMSQVPAW